MSVYLRGSMSAWPRNKGAGTQSEAHLSPSLAELRPRSREAGWPRAAPRGRLLRAFALAAASARSSLPRSPASPASPHRSAPLSLL